MKYSEYLRKVAALLSEYNCYICPLLNHATSLQEPRIFKEKLQNTIRDELAWQNESLGETSTTLSRSLGVGIEGRKKWLEALAQCSEEGEK